MFLYFCWFCTWSKVGCLEVLIHLFWSFLLCVSDKHSCCLHFEHLFYGSKYLLSVSICFRISIQVFHDMQALMAAVLLDVRTGVVDPYWAVDLIDFCVFISVGLTSIFKHIFHFTLYLYEPCMFHTSVCSWK